MKGKLTACLPVAAQRPAEGVPSMPRRARSAVGRRVAFALGVVLGAGGLAPAMSAERLNMAIDGPDAEVEVFVRLTTPSVAELNIEARRATGALASRGAQQAQAAAVEAEQARVRQQLASFGVTELSALRVGANGLRVRVPASELANIAALPGVQSVGRVELHTIDHAQSVPAVGAPQVWEQLGVRGEDIRVGIIDTGIDYFHANFGGSGNPADYAANNRNVIEPGSFPTAKVVGGWDFAGPTYNAQIASSVPQPDPDPVDVNGHGTHVAGSAAGFGVPGTIGPGVAPAAKLYALKVFGDGGGSTNLTSDAIEWALDPNGDGDMSDHLDVINMSLGSNFGMPTDPSSISAHNAAELGIIVVASAGNSGAVPYVTGSPGVAPAVISTAAVTPPGRLYSRVNITAPAAIAGFKANFEGAGPVQLSSIAPVSGTVVRGAPLDGCTALTNASEVAGNIVLLQRGTCAFLVKYLSAQAAGARAVLMFNNAAGAPIVMGGLTSAVTIPGVMVSLADGSQIAAAATATASSPVQATLDAAPNPALDEQIAGFSSRGPGHGGSTFKPDIAAPGVAIISAGVGSGTGPANLQGTSMAAPHVAGAAALLRQVHPTLAQWEIKALLQNSTVDANPSSETSLARQGVGSLRVSKAVALTSYASPGGVSFGRLNPAAPVSLAQPIALQNLSHKTRRFQVTHRPQQTYPGVSVQCPGALSVGPGLVRYAQIRLRFDPRVAPAQGVFDDASRSQTEVDGWCILSDGVDELRVGYLAVVDSASRMWVGLANRSTVHRVRNEGPGVGLAEAFTFLGEGGESASESPMHPLRYTGVRTGNPGVFFGDDVAEFALSIHGKYEHPADMRVEIYIDANRDGVDETLLVADDLSRLVSNQPAGTHVTAQFNLTGGGGFLDWVVTGFDYNDHTIVLPFTKAASGGRVPDSFNYRIVTISRDGTRSTQTGSFDFAQELVPDLTDFALAGGEQAEIRLSRAGEGTLLWLFRNNGDHDQSFIAGIHRSAAR